MGQETGVRRYNIGSIRCLLLLLIFSAVEYPMGPAKGGVLSGDRITQRRSPLIVRVDQPGFRVEDLTAVPGQQALFQISLPSADDLAREGATEGTFVLIRNVPPTIKMSAGMQIGRIWIVPLSEAGELRFLSTPETKGDFAFQFYLMGSGNRVLAEQTVRVSLQVPQTVETVATASPQIEGSAQSPPPEPLAPEEESILLARGQEVLQQGGIAAARLIFEELATRGSARAALALAKTYDPAFISKSATSALAPNTEDALKWYQRAEELGSLEAQRRRAELGGRF